MTVKPAQRTESVKEYYFSQKLAQIDRMTSTGIDVISLGIGSPDQPPSPHVINALVAEAMKPTSHGYQSYKGILKLRQAYAGWYRKYFNVTLNPEEEILTLMGSKEGIMHISMTFVDNGDEVLTPDPGYATYSSATRLAGGTVRNYDLVEQNGWMPDIDALENSDLSRVKLMWINYPHMPSGTKATAALFKRLVAFARKHSILLCNDNPYSFILNNDYLSILSVPGAKDTALELNSLSKSHNMAGWRIGMVAGNSDYVKQILKVKSNMDSGMFLAMQIAAVEALNSPESWYRSVNEVYVKRRTIAEGIMKLLNCRYNASQTGLFVWGRIPDEVVSCEEWIEDILQKAYVFITPGFIFGKNGERYIRISLCASEDRLSEAKDRLDAFVKQQQ
ncbi:MAG: aminotransferase class I/II-fold pyridoxal phosphate-dependent enzyme [Bacteroidales bacterium]|jgi:aspartate/methionine/tyrosine aminotransferase|nr:aminotransferase class I/II-fold pyridoxal phosphate-dependent enzyme [Bacteroidales bacterium]